MINDSFDTFKHAVELAAERWRERAYEEYMTGFLTKTIKQATVLNIPEGTTHETKEAILKESTSSIAATAKKVVNNALLDEHNSLHNVDMAHEISSPKNFNESVQQLLAEHIYNEAKDRATVLENEFEAGTMNNFKSEEVLEHIESSFESLQFDTRFDNGVALRKKMKFLLSLEAEDVVSDIKADVAKLVEETEAKNSVIRDAVTQINEKREEIEDKLNGTEDDDDDDEGEEEEGSEDKKGSEGDESSDDGFATENYSLSREDLYTVHITTGLRGVDISTENFNRIYDENSFSKEAAEEILKDFKELDGIDADTISEDDEDALSLSSVTDAVYDDGDSGSESAEMDYVDDNDERIEIDSSKFEYNEEDYEAEDLDGSEESEEAMAREVFPLSFEKLNNRSVSYTPKMAAYLALSKDSGKKFFDCVNNRSLEMIRLLSKEDNPMDEVEKDKTNNEIEKKIEHINNLKGDTEKFMDNMGILGILSGDYQRTDDPLDNAVKSMFKPEILEPKGSPDISKEDLHAHELAEILKIGLEISEVKDNIVKGVNVNGNGKTLGYLNELLNEKMFELDPTERVDIENKLDALQSIESVIPISEVANIQAFMSKTANADAPDRIEIPSLKDIDGYGYSFNDEIEKIKKECHKNYKDRFAGKHTVVNFDIDKLVDFIADERDTSKFDTNMFERILAKCSENVDITNSTEGLVILNKARVLTTAFVTADRLGMFSKEEIKRLQRTFYG